MKERLNINTVVKESMKEFGNVQVVCKLSNILENLGVSLKELSDLTGIRYATLHELANNKKVTLNLQHTLAIMVVLRINSFDELFEMSFEEDNKEDEFNKESFETHEEEKGLPEYVLNRREENRQKVTEWKTAYKKTLE